MTVIRKKKENYKVKCETGEHEVVGMQIVRLCQAGYLIESAKRNFVQEILNSVLNELSVSDISHSSEFYSNFMPMVSEQVTERLKSFFIYRLDHTGFKAPVNLQADKGINVHRTRQFTSVVTVIPNLSNWNLPNC